ncbi:hypothetical protein [Granulicella sp. L60]|jgi:hypothetical protein|uniref:hypothetical protein n=1 Tax=Granulicella sp. L60 TaxID=1641866 RepID=UPI00131C19AE|nr:hypothetical protein [Granulicella sp. L60]
MKRSESLKETFSKALIRTKPHNEEVLIATDRVPAATLIDLIPRQTRENLGEQSEPVSENVRSYSCHPIKGEL